MPVLTVLCVIPCELDDSYLRLYREALLRWNREGLAETQIILLPQGKAPGLQTDFEVVSTPFERVDGYPVWDVMRQIRAAWPCVRGQYVTVDHPEFLWGPGRLDKTIAWLRGYRPIYGLGNLRRAGSLEEVTSLQARDLSQEPSLWFMQRLQAGEWDEAARLFEWLSTMHWMYWCPTGLRTPPRPGTSDWIEDVFYIDKAWLDAWGFTRYDNEMPFQDVWDVLQVAIRTQQLYGVQFECTRMPMDVNKLYHLWHPRMRNNLTPKMRDWFLAQPQRWGQSAFSDPDLWACLIARDNAAVRRLRFGGRGTAATYRAAVSRWLDAGGVEIMQDFFRERRDRALR